MAKQAPEAKVKLKINEIIKKYRGKHTNPIMQGMGQNGTHDKLCCINGYFLSVEAKAGKGGLTSLQAMYGREMYEAGGIAIVVNEENMDGLEMVCQGLSSGELVHTLSLPSDKLVELGAEPAPFELLRRAAYVIMWLPFLKNDKLQLVGKYKPFTPVRQGQPAADQGAALDAPADNEGDTDAGA